MTLDQFVADFVALAMFLGTLGTLLETLGNAFKKPALIMLGQKLEALGLDIPELLTGAKAKALGNARPAVPPLTTLALVLLSLLLVHCSGALTAAQKERLALGALRDAKAFCADPDVVASENTEIQAACAGLKVGASLVPAATSATPAASSSAAP